MAVARSTIRVLLAYATRYGSTQEVAEAIAATLRENGLDVDVQPASQVHTLAGYTAVVLGAPLHIGSWHKDTLSFLVRHQETLAHRPVAVFALGPVVQGDAQEFQDSRAQLDTELARFPWLTPLAVAVFAGKYDPAKLHFTDKLVTLPPASPLKNLPASDLRDWAAIRTWATDLASRLQPTPAAVARS